MTYRALLFALALLATDAAFAEIPPGAARPDLPGIRGAVIQSRDINPGWYAVSGARELCANSLETDALLCWPSLGGRLTDLRATGDGFIAAGYAALDGVTELYLVLSDGRSIEILEPPAREQDGAPRGWPQLVVDDGRLRGLVWLEGRTQDELVVKAARFDDGGWLPPRVVSLPTNGSQVAPAVTVLHDGRWLAVWTAFDGRDDETVWSLFDGARWQPPQPLHEDNGSPDITPRLIATGAGAVVAWNHFDGADYRIRTAFFDGREWSDIDHASGRGADDPQLGRSRDGKLLLSYSTVLPAQWTVVELDARGRELRRASIPSDNAYRPVLRWHADLVSARWFDFDAGTATAGWEASR